MPAIRGDRCVFSAAAFAIAVSFAGGLGCSTTSNPAPAHPPKPAPQTSTPTEPESSGTLATEQQPVPTPRQDVVDVLHGKAVADPYRWLEQLDHKTKAWASAQDAHARRTLTAIPGREGLAKRLKALSYIDWTSAPTRRARRYFFARQHADKEKVVYYWKQGENGAPRVLLDPNTLSRDGSVSVRGMSVSHDGLKVAYKLSQNAADESTLHVMDIGSGKTSAVDRISGAKYARASWTPNSDGFYYVRLPVGSAIPVAERPGHAALYFHRLGDDPKNDRRIRDKTGDPRTFLAAELSRDGRFLFVTISFGWTRTDVYYRDFRRHKALQPFAVGLPARFQVYAWRGKIYVRTNHQAPNWRLMRVDPRRIAMNQWQEIVAQDKAAVLQDFAIRGGHLSLQYLQHASSLLKVARLDGKVLREVKLPGIGSAEGLTGHPEDDTAYYSFESFIQPRTIYRTSVRRGGKTPYFTPKVPIDSRPYRVEQVHYPSKDGTQISMFVVRRKDAPMNGSTPFQLYGYGGFNISLTPRFFARNFAWLEHGAGIAVPNLRGGGEYGEAWHKAGMLTHKQNVFDDFIAAAEFLSRKGYTRPDRLAIRGGSNGGLLVGAAMTQRPDLFRAVACHVPLLDMVRYHLFGSGRTWIAEYGSAEDPQQFAALLAYSPYHRVKAGTAYPALLMMASDSDDRVDPMHARKFTAAIQHASSSGLPVLLRVETNAGHGGGDMIKKAVQARADEYAFLLREIGVPLSSR